MSGSIHSIRMLHALCSAHKKTDGKRVLCCANAHFLLPISACKEDSCAEGEYTPPRVYKAGLWDFFALADQMQKTAQKTAGSIAAGKMVSSLSHPVQWTIEAAKPWLEFLSFAIIQTQSYLCFVETGLFCCLFSAVPSPQQWSN